MNRYDRRGAEKRSTRIGVAFALAMLATCIAGVDLAAQGSVRIVDADEGIPIPHATVHFACLDNCDRDSAAIGITDERGAVRVPIVGRIAVTVEHVGFRTRHDTLASGANATLSLTSTGSTTGEVVVTGQYAPIGSDRSLYDVRVLGRETIEARAAQDLRELMSSELNVRLEQDNVLGSSLAIQGLSGQNVKVLVDGLPVVGRIGGSIDVGQILLNNVERVEIVEGPLSVAYGTDALGGVINVVTDRSARGGSVADVNAYYESAGTWNLDARVVHIAGETRIGLSGGRYFFGGFSDPDTSRFKSWKPREQYFGEWDATHYLGSFSLSYTGRLFSEYILNRGIPRAPYRETAFDDTYRTTRLTNRIQARGVVAEHLLELSAALSGYARRKNTYVKNLVTLDERLTDVPDDHDTSRFTAWNIRATYGSLSTEDAFSWQSGLDLNIEKAAGGRIAERSKALGDHALFASIRLAPFNRFVVQPGLRYAYNTLYDAPLIPSVNVKLDLFSNTVLRASYARGFRAPSLRDLYFEFVDINHNIRGNEDLRAEVSDNVNLSLNWSRKREREAVELGLHGFYNDVADLITLVDAGNGLYTYENVGTHRTLGLKTVGRFKGKALSLNAGASLIGRYNSLAETRDVGRFSYAPEVTTELTWTPSLLRGGTISADYKYTGEIPSFGLDADDRVVERSVDDYHTLDLSLHYPLFGERLAVRGGVKNVFDVTDVAASTAGGAHNAEGSALPVSWGRTFFLDVNVEIGE